MTTPKATKKSTILKRKKEIDDIVKMWFGEVVTITITLDTDTIIKADYTYKNGIITETVHVSYDSVSWDLTRDNEYKEDQAGYYTDTGLDRLYLGIKHAFQPKRTMTTYDKLQYNVTGHEFAGASNEQFV